MDANVKDALCDDWCDRLSKYTLDEIRLGVSDVFDEARGKLRSINEVQVEVAILHRHAHLVASLPSEKEVASDPYSHKEPLGQRKAAADEVMRKHGFLRDDQ